MENGHTVDVSVPYQTGENPEQDAWYTAFFIENHLDYFAYPDRVASPEKVRFIVYTDDEERYYPCSDRMFESIMNRMRSFFLQEKYNEALQGVLEMIERQIEDEDEKNYLRSLIMIKYKHETREEIMIPSRLEKRLVKIFLNRTQIEDPCVFIKAERNRLVSNALNSPAFKTAFNQSEKNSISNNLSTIPDIRNAINRLQLTRLLTLSGCHTLWNKEAATTMYVDDYLKLFNRTMIGNGLAPLLHFLGISDPMVFKETVRPRKILWLADESGEVLLDIAVIRFLVKLGHKIIIAFKDGPLYTKTGFFDCKNDEILSRQLHDAIWIKEKNMGKNDLVDILRSDNSIFIISDGSRENLNFLLATTTFARIFKEVDGVISKGVEQKNRLFFTHFQFTQDIFSICEDENGTLVIDYKPRHPEVIKFSHGALEERAKAIIMKMESAKKEGKTVIFYSGIIGSIPGKISIAKKIMSTAIDLIKQQSVMTFIINPSDHFEPGMDADDLMYMWEIVQKSGLINIWRFQTYDDIARAFQAMDRKIPPEWVGKDATFSTGCTKEMKIALAVQEKHPELQIIGPSKEKFMRREAYGIGKMYDKRLALNG